MPWLIDEEVKQLPARVEWPPTRKPEDWMIDESELLADQIEEATRKDRDMQVLKAASAARPASAGSSATSDQSQRRRSTALEREQLREESAMSAADRMLAKAMEMEAAEAEKKARQDAATSAKLKKMGISPKFFEPTPPAKAEIVLPPPPPKGWYPVSKN